MVVRYSSLAKDTMINMSNNKKEITYGLVCSWQKNIAGIFDICSYYGSNEQEYTYIKILMDKIDDIVFEKNQSNIELNNDEIKKLLDFIDVIQKESETWDEWSIITGKSLEELEDFKYRLRELTNYEK